MLSKRKFFNPTFENTIYGGVNEKNLIKANQDSEAVLEAKAVPSSIIIKFHKNYDTNEVTYYFAITF